MRRSAFWGILLLFLLPFALSAQTARLSGRVTSQAGAPLVGVRVAEKGTRKAVFTDSDGRYELRNVAANAVITFTLIGYRDEERAADASGAEPGVKASEATLDVMLTEGVMLNALEVVGTRRLARSAVNTPVPVDVIDVSELSVVSGQLDLNLFLQQIAPAFNSTRQSGADGSDHVDPASLRGLGPDQTLVLINGKRRHQSSLINIFGSRGRGNTGTDLNSIPLAAIERIEILRDGASAQYGSDAISGVINIVLKSDTDGFSGNLTAGTRDGTPPSKFAVLGNGRDGEELQLNGNYGLALGNGGFLNATADFLKKGRTNRPADPATFDIYRRQFGDAEAENYGLFINSAVPLSERSSFYGFGGFGFRQTDAYAWTREADSDRNVPAIYPNGFDPRILSDITDGSLSAGVRRTTSSGWDIDVNNTFGLNRFHYSVDGTLNASLLEQSPTHFDAGGFQLIQNTTGVRMTKLFDRVRHGLNVSLGVEHRRENYQIFAGEEGSWRNYGVNAAGVDTLGRPAGSQGFPGFQPVNELDESRSNTGGFLDLELDASERFMVSAAARLEHYSDFGSTLNGKLATRLMLSDAFALRASASTGFRAPSLAQIYFNSTFTDFVSGQAVDKIIARNDAQITRVLGIPELTEEKAVNASVGFTARAGNFTLTVDGYRVEIQDRIVLTGAFEDTDPDIGSQLQALGVSAAQFFTNALDTRTLGLDVVLAHGFFLGQHQLRTALAGNFNDMKLNDIHTSPQLSGKEDIYFGSREQHFLVASAPPSKVALSLDHSAGRFDNSLRLTHYGRVVLIDWLDTKDIYESRRTLDVSTSYRLSNRARVTFGGSNILNAYPSQQDTETETGGVWDAVQMGFSGAFWFARLNFGL